MTSMGGRGLMCGAIVVMLGATVSACAPSKEQLSDESCELKASKAALDESCAIEVSKREIAAKLRGTSYEKYKVHFDPAAKLWIVMAYNESGPPDSHVYLSIAPTGEVKDLRGAP